MFDEEIDDLLNDDLVNDPKPPMDNSVFEELLGDEDLGNNIEWEGVKEVGGAGGFGESQFDQGATYKQVVEGRLNDRRSNLQPWTDQVSNMLGQAVVGEIVGGTIEGVGYLLDVGSMADYLSGEETKWGNWLTEIGQATREAAQENMAIYEENPGEMNMSDPGYWFKNGVSVASSLSMLVPSMAATKALGFLGKTASKGAGMMSKSMDVASKMGVQATWMTEGVSQAIVSRHIENSMEAHGTFKDQRQKMLQEVNPKTGKTFTEEEANLIASESAAYNYRHGWAMLLQDIPQYLALGRVFNPLSMKMENALSNVAKKGYGPKWLKEGASTFVSEGAEEGYQFYISEKGKLLSDLKSGLITEDEYNIKISEAIGSDEAGTSMLFGGLGGNLFQAAGKGANAVFKSKSRREMETKAADNYNADLKTRGLQIAVLQKQLAEADQTDNEKFRERALNSMMTETLIDAINQGKLESTVEALIAGPQMTEEELAGFEKNHGIEYSPELAKKYTPKILENAEKIKKMHYKNLNKAENKGVHKNIVTAITMNEFQAQESLGLIKDLDKEYQEILNQSPFTARNPSGYLDRKSRLKVNKKAIEQAIIISQAAMDKTIDPRIKKQYDSIIKNHEKSLASFEKELVNVEELKKDRTSEEITSDSKAISAHDNIEGELIFNRTDALLLEDSITRNQDDIKQLSKKSHQKEFNKNSILNDINKLEDETSVEEAIADFEKNPDYKNDSAEKKEITEAFVARKNTIKEEKKVAAAEATAKAYKEQQEAAVAAKNKNPKFPDSNANVDVTESVEDEHMVEEIDFETQHEQEDAETVAVKESGAKSIALLDKVQNTKAYQDWKHNGTNKIGQKITYNISGDDQGRKSPAQKSLISKFRKQIKDGTPVTQDIYDMLPIVAFVGNGRSIFTFLQAKPAKGDPSYDAYQSSTAAERKVIIDKLYKGEPVVSEIYATSGGKLMLETDEDGMPAENSVLDLQQIKSIDDVELAYTNLDGKMLNLSTKEQNRDFAGKIIKVTDGDGNKSPYRGGLFLILNKADGTKFPVRMNFKKNTREQADAIADIIIEIAVPSTKGEDKNIELHQPLSLVDEKLRDKIKEVMGPELAVLGKDPKMSEIVNMFVYVSERTKEMSSKLYWSGENLYYGEDGVITPANKNSQAEKDKLVDFLTNKKRRQLSINMWNENPKYRKFALETGIINTNVIAHEPAFQTDLGSSYTAKNGKEYKYRIQTYVKPVQNYAPAPIEKVSAVSSEGKIIPQELQLRMNKTKSVGITINNEGRPVATYYGPKRLGTNPTKQFPLLSQAMAEYKKDIDKLEAPKTVEVIPNVVKAPAPKPVVNKKSPEVTEPISDEDYNDFVDNGDVSEDTLINIAYLIKRKKAMSPREKAIFADKTGEINDFLKSIAKDVKIDVSLPNIKKNIGYVGRFKNGEALLLDKRDHTSTLIITKEGDNYSLTVDANMFDYSLREVTNRPDSAFNYVFEQVSNENITDPKNTEFVIKKYPRLKLDGRKITVIEKGKLELRRGKLGVVEELSLEKVESTKKPIEQSPTPTKTRRKIKPAINFKGDGGILQTKVEPAVKGDQNTFKNDDPQKINKNCK